MSFFENEKIQEWLIVLNDNLRTTKKIWVYILAAVLVLAIPLAFGFKALFFKLTFKNYSGPAVNQPMVKIEPLQILEKKVLKLSNNNYSGFIRLKNMNLDWGMPEQTYTAIFKTLGGTTAATVSGKTFILPASEKLIVFSKFSSQQEPQVLDFSLGEAKFLLKPEMPPIELSVSRVELANKSSELTVGAAVFNKSPFRLSAVHLYALVYDKNNEIIAVNSTSVNDVNSLETRSFQMYWPKTMPDAARAEIRSEVNIFDRALFSTQPGRSQFETDPD
ncbi:MAG: hypothetical protein HY336_00450 [Candidatus Doudnabacteria bacterium]|nr:hypothetical protein [Candidatus Doudnabacteria bacterium]